MSLSTKLRLHVSTAWLGMLALACTFVFLGALPAQAQDPDFIDVADPGLVVIDTPLYTVGNSNGNSVQIRLCNVSDVDQLVGMATYGIPCGVGPPIGQPQQHPSFDEVNAQVYFDSKDHVLKPGHCVVLTVRIPPCGEFCAYQVDVFTGPVITQFLGSDQYGGRLLGGWLYLCDENPPRARGR